MFVKTTVAFFTVQCFRNHSECCIFALSDYATSHYIRWQNTHTHTHTHIKVSNHLDDNHVVHKARHSICWACDQSASLFSTRECRIYVIAILANAMKFYGILPVLGEVFISIQGRNNLIARGCTVWRMIICPHSLSTQINGNRDHIAFCQVRLTVSDSSNCAPTQN